MKGKIVYAILLASVLLFENAYVTEAKNVSDYSNGVDVEYTDLAVVDFDEPAEPIDPEQPYSYIVNTKTTGLNVRSGPGLNYSIIGSFAKGSTVDCSFISPSGNGKWWKATGKDEYTGKRITGYVDSTYLKSKGIY